MTNCKNCGAPLTKAGKCEYCGTEYAAPAQEGVEYARVVLDGQQIGRLVAPAHEMVVMWADDKPIYV